MMTQEEKKAKKKEYNKAYREAKKNGTFVAKTSLTAEERKANNKASKKKWRDANQDKIKAYTAANADKAREASTLWRENNQDKVKAYNEATRETRIAKMKARREAKKLPYYIVYCIPNYDGKGGNYAGVTNQPQKRMQAHILAGKVNTDDFFILDVKTDKLEAYASETAFHNKGYHGGR